MKVRYARLGWSAHHGTRIQRRLVEEGILDAETVEANNTRKRILRVSAQAHQMLGVDEKSKKHRESIAHAYWKHEYARRYREKGYDVEVEHPRVGGRVDVHAQRQTKRVAIEIETGKSDVVCNVRNCLRSRYEKVLVVATDQHAMRTIERSLARAGLLIAGRVKLVLGDRGKGHVLQPRIRRVD